MLTELVLDVVDDMTTNFRTDFVMRLERSFFKTMGSEWRSKIQEFDVEMRVKFFEMMMETTRQDTYRKQEDAMTVHSNRVRQAEAKEGDGDER